MASRSRIRVVFSTQSTGGFQARMGLEPVCPSCEKRLGISRNPQTTLVIPQEISSLIFSARLAAEELDVELELLDISSLSIVQRLKELANGKPVPRVEIGDEFLTGFPTKQDIIKMYQTLISDSFDLRTS